MFSGALSLLWCAVWLFFITDNPDDHMYISEQEKKYIASNRANNVEKVRSIKKNFSTSFFTSETLHNEMP